MVATFGAQLHPSNFVAIDTLKTAGEGVQHSGARNVRAGLILSCYCKRGYIEL